MQKFHVDIIRYLFFLNENHCEQKKKKKIVIVKNNIAIRIAGKVSRYIDASMNRATPSKCRFAGCSEEDATQRWGKAVTGCWRSAGS